MRGTPGKRRNAETDHTFIKPPFPEPESLPGAYFNSHGETRYPCYLCVIIKEKGPRVQRIITIFRAVKITVQLCLRDKACHSPPQIQGYLDESYAGERKQCSKRWISFSMGFRNNAQKVHTISTLPSSFCSRSQVMSNQPAMTDSSHVLSATGAQLTNRSFTNPILN